MPPLLIRILMGAVAAEIAVLTFHQGTVLALGSMGLAQGAVYSMVPVPPLGIPRIVNLCFWGGLYGAVYGMVWPRLTIPSWLSGLCLGIIASLVGMFIVASIKGTPIANGWAAWPMARSLIINGMWGVGVGLIAPLLFARVMPLVQRSADRR